MSRIVLNWAPPRLGDWRGRRKLIPKVPDPTSAQQQAAGADSAQSTRCNRISLEPFRFPAKSPFDRGTIEPSESSACT